MYQPSESLFKKVMQFTSEVRKLDPSCVVKVHQTDVDCVISCYSLKYNQSTQYAVWDVYHAGKATGKHEGATIGKFRIN